MNIRIVTAIAVIIAAVEVATVAFATPVHPKYPCPPKCGQHSASAQDSYGIWRLWVK